MRLATAFVSHRRKIFAGLIFLSLVAMSMSTPSAQAWVVPSAEAGSLL